MRKFSLRRILVFSIFLSGNLFCQDRSAEKIDESLSYGELRSTAIDHLRKDSIDSAIYYMEFAHKKFPENDMQSLKILGQMYTKAGLFSKAVSVWKEGIYKGYYYDLNNEVYQRLYKDNIEFAKLAKIEKDKINALHILTEVLLPENYDNKERYPVLFIFHGNNRNIETSKLSWVSETMKNEYISVFLQSYVPMNDSTFQWLTTDDGKTNEEFRKIYDNVIKTYSVDTDRIIFAGMSAGGRKAVEYAFSEFVPVSGLVLNCPVIPADITEEEVKQFAEKNKRIGIITGEKDFALAAQKKLISDIENLNGKVKLLVNQDLGHEFSENFPVIFDEYLRWVKE